ncbi:uncharacterized protein ACA1_279410 [Acanthamoeba castellanii str. Neff]|uniref:Uncharacterized protein n=1 Tax=Acanthamoeba castellanii (strain ATCC 30010 / Neff) TaxID=1257118 RepID=L8H616_ACACF|nr:uncharacterized protein ACA1_279410 [Acanthamoeba castellanii str. Neff]ELR20959.1 hypothetical protein ACA1_279410 [Acanthamoeba castellanii str. Neff]
MSINNPLFLQSFEETQPDEDLRFHYIVHTSLDMIEEKSMAASAGAKKQKSQLDMFLGLLHPHRRAQPMAM